MLGMATLAGSEVPKPAGTVLAGMAGGAAGMDGIGMPPMKGFIIGDIIYGLEYAL